MELALDDAAGGGQAVQGAVGDGRAEAEAGGRLLRGEGAVGAGVPGEQIAERVRDRFGERFGDADRQGRAQGVAEAARVLDGGPVVRAGDPHPDGAAGGGQLPGPCLLRAALGQFGAGQRSQQPQDVGDALGVLDPAVLRAPLKLALQLGQHLGVQQLAQLRPAQQLGQQPGIQRQRGRPALGERGVALVEELGDIAEQQRAGEGGRLGGGDLHQAHPAGLDIAHQFRQSRYVEDVLETFAHRLQHDREGPELARHLEQLGGTLALLPQRGALAGAAPGQQESAGGAFAEPGGEQRGAAHLVGDELVDVTVVEDDIGGPDRRLLRVPLRARGGRARLRGRIGERAVEEVEAHQVRVRQPQHDAVVGMHHLGVQAVALGEPGAQGQRPGSVDLRAEGGVDDDPPVAELVPEALDDDGAVVRDMPAGLPLLGEIAQDVARRPVVEPGGGETGAGVLGCHRADLAQERAERAAQLQGAAELVALPERQPAGHPGGGGDQDPVAGDVLDAPGRRAEREDVADPGLVDHLLVQLSHPSPAPLAGVGAGQEDAEQPAVGDRATGGDGQPLRPGPARDRAREAVPHQARPQFGEGVGGVAAGEHVQHTVERRLRERGERRRPPDDGQQRPDVPGVHRAHRDDLLGQHIQRIGGHPQRLDPPGAHPLGDHRGLDEIAAVLGEDDAPGDRADLVAGAAHPLEPGGDRRRRFHLDNEIDRAHVDAQLQTGGGDHGRQSARLQVLLHLGALLLGDRTVVRAGQQRRRALGGPGLGHQLGGGVVLGQGLPVGALVGDLVETVAQPLRQAAGVGEDDRGAVRLDQIGDLLLDLRPDGRLLARSAVLYGGAAQLSHVLHRDDHREVEALAGRRLDDLHPPLWRQIAGHLLHRAHRRRQADPAGRTGAAGATGTAQLVQPFQRQRQMRTALRTGDGVHLVQDDRLYARQGLPGRRRQHQEQRFGGGDEDVGRAVGDRPALGGRGVPGADTHRDVRLGQPQPHRLLPDTRQRTAQIPLDIDGQGLERGDVQHPAALLRLGRRRRARQCVQRRQERGQRLAGARRRHHQNVRPRADRPPRALLRGGGRAEGPREPAAGRGRERIER